MARRGKSHGGEPTAASNNNAMLAMAAGFGGIVIIGFVVLSSGKGADPQTASTDERETPTATPRPRESASAAKETDAARQRRLNDMIDEAASRFGRKDLDGARKKLAQARAQA